MREKQRGMMYISKFLKCRIQLAGKNIAIDLFG